MLLELNQSALACQELREVGEEVLALLERLAAGESAGSVRKRWPPGRRPKAAVVEAVAALAPEEQRLLCKAVASDLIFDEKFGDPTFEFAFPGLDATVQEAGKALLVSVYEDVFCGKKGIAVAGKEVSRTIWEESFRKANPEVEVCPACLSSPLEGPARNSSLSDADHYLPKSKYPALVVHGLNLVLMCQSCNGRLKGALDPLVDAGEMVPLDEIWFPYRRAGIDEVVLEFSPAERSTLALGGSLEVRERAQRYERMFALVERWTEALHSIADRLPSLLLIRLKTSVDDASIREELESQKETADFDLTYEERAFLKSRYYGWLLNTPKAFQDLVAEVETLRKERRELTP